MTNKEYEWKRAECWIEFCKEHPIETPNMAIGEAFCAAFDRAYALGKQEKYAEGERVVTWRRKELIRLYKEKVEIKGNARSSQREKDRAIGWCNALRYILQCDFSTDDGVVVAENTTTTQKRAELKEEIRDILMYTETENRWQEPHKFGGSRQPVADHKDSGDDRRLNVAVQIMSGIMSNEAMMNNLASGESTVEGVTGCIVNAAITYTDALLAKFEKKTI